MPTDRPRRRRPRLDVRKTYKLYIGGAFPRSESGRSYVVERRQGPVPRQRLAGLPQGRPRRRRRRAQGVRRLVRRARLQPRPGALPGRRDARGPARPVRRRGAARRGHRASARPQAARGRGDRPLGLVRRLGRQDRPGRRRHQPGRRAVLRLLHPRADRRGRRARARRSRRCSAWSACSPRSIVTGNTCVVAASHERPLPAVTLAEVLATSDVPGGVVNILTGQHGRDRRRGWPRTWTSTRST